jgi:hypothetical protein
MALRPASCLVLLRMGFAKQRTSPFALVGSYSTVSPLLSCLSGLLSVALSLALRPVDVIDHPALRSPDFPLRQFEAIASTPSQRSQ